MSRNRVIGRDGTLPPELNFPKDKKHFRNVTMGKTIAVGRVTEEGIERDFGQPLPGRRTLVITNQKHYVPPKGFGVEVVRNIGQIVARCRHEEIFVIGGGQIYNAFAPYVTRMIITEVDVDIKGDTFFTEIDKNIWQEGDKKSFPADTKNKYPFSIVEYIRKPPSK